MADPPQRLRRDLGGIALLAWAVFLTASLVTYDAADPVEPPVWPLRSLYTPDALVHPQALEITNACGYWGALVAGGLLSAVGLGAVLVVALLFALSALLLLRVDCSAPALRSLGWTLVLVALTTAAALAPLGLSGLPVVGLGGYLGAMAASWLGLHFAAAGAWILTLTLLAFGLLLATDYLLLRVGHSVARRSAVAAAGGLQCASRVLPMGAIGQRVLKGGGGKPFAGGGPLDSLAAQSRRRTTDVDGGVKLIGGPVAGEIQPAIKVRGRALEQPGGPDGGAVPAESDTPAAAAAGPGNSAAEGSAAEGSADSIAAEPSHVRELEVDGETITLRQDSAQSSAPHFKIKRPKNRQDDREALFEALSEELPAGAEEYTLPALDLLLESDDVCYEEQAKEVRRKAKILEETFLNFGFNIRVVEIETGPVIAQYEVELEAGLRLSKITGLADDLAIALRVPSVRIVAPIPGKNTVGIEVPNESRQVVRLREVIEECGAAGQKMKIPIFLGKDVSGNPLTVDLASMPHLLIAGRTGTGKSVCLNAIITSMLMTRRPDEVRMLMIDPKMVELSGYGRLPHLMHPVVTDMKKAEAILAWAVEKMEERYSLLARVGVRHISSYNQLGREELCRRLEIDDFDDSPGVADHLPFIVIVADEMADLMMTAGKEVEQHIIRLAQKSRAVGIHLILATQKPTVDVITGLIKSNLPARIAFQVASRTDSRVVLDENGADKLLGNGDMLFLWPGTSTLLRGQGTYLGDDEIDRVVDHCSRGEQNFVGELMNLKVEEAGGEGEPTAGPFKKRDELYESAVDVVIREGRGSVSLLQRALGIGYGRGARLIDFMAEDGIVGPYNGSQARDVLISIAEWESMQQSGDAEEESASGDGLPPVDLDSTPLRRNTIQRGSSWDDPDQEQTQGAAAPVVPEGAFRGEERPEEEEDESAPPWH